MSANWIWWGRICQKVRGGVSSGALCSLPGVSAQVEGALPSSSLLSVCSVRSCCHHLLVASSFSCLLWVGIVTERSELGSLGENEAKRWSDIGASSEGRHGEGGRVQGGLRRPAGGGLTQVSPGGGWDTQVGGRSLFVCWFTQTTAFCQCQCRV